MPRPGHAPREGRVRSARRTSFLGLAELPLCVGEPVSELGGVECIRRHRLGDEIPQDLYKAVAEVLIFVLRLSGRIR